MSAVPWAQIVAAAEQAARLLPPPAGTVASIALALARVVLDSGCTVIGCPDDVKARLLAADIPAAGDAMRAARARAGHRAAGLDRATIDARFRRDADDYAAEMDPGDEDPKGAA